MKKIININLSGRVIPIEDSAFETLKRYIDSLRSYFAREDGRDEIINDIESRIAELMNEKIRKGAAAITDEDVDGIIAMMGRIEDFAQADGEDAAAASATTLTGNPNFTFNVSNSAGKRLYRSTNDKYLGGVCGGLANYFNVDPAVVRLLFFLVAWSGIGIFLYILMWIILPERSLEPTHGKRFFRNPDDKIIAGVAGGLAAYFNTRVWPIRIAFAAPLLLTVIFGILHAIFNSFDGDFSPNMFVAPFTGTFIFIYIILWIVMREASSPYELMEMRGERVDVNRIRQNVQEEIGARVQTFGEEVKASATNLGAKAKQFADTRGKEFANEFTATARPAAKGIVNVVGTLLKAMFIFVGGCIALGLFAFLMVVLFGGVAWSPINNFIWTSSTQQFLAYSTLILFVTVPVVAFITWGVRRIMRIRSRSNRLGWAFGILWTLGWFALIGFSVSMGRDFQARERVSEEVSISQPAGSMLINVTEPPIRYRGDSWMFDSDERGFDITNDSLRIGEIDIAVIPSEDSLYHVTVLKNASGSSLVRAEERAENIQFGIQQSDSTITLPSGYTIYRQDKWRGQELVVEIKVPVGRKIKFDESVDDIHGNYILMMYDEDNSWRRRNRWRYYNGFHVDVNEEYIMSKDGKLVKTNEILNKDTEERAVERADSLIREKERRERMMDSLRREEERSQRNEEDGTTMLTLPLIPVLGM